MIQVLISQMLRLAEICTIHEGYSDELCSLESSDYNVSMEDVSG